MKSMKIGVAILATILSAVTVNAQNSKKEIAIDKEVVINAPIGKAWEVLGPQFADAYIWASAIKHSEARNHESLNGSTCTERGCKVKGIGDVKEKLLSYSESEHKLSYQVYEGMPKMIKNAVNYWTFVSTPDGKTKVISHIEMRVGGLMGSMMKGMMKRKMTKLQSEVVEEFSYYVENGTPHPRKIKSNNK
jgi:uncharacterized membrane protein